MAVIKKVMAGDIKLDGTDIDTYELSASVLTQSIQGSSVGIAADTSTGVVALTLPEIAELGLNTSKLSVCIYDSGKNAATKNITVTAFAGNKINNLDALVVDVDSANLILTICGGDWVASNTAI
jgi:hypothetical protein